jgi:hypothetical protein
MGLGRRDTDRELAHCRLVVLARAARLIGRGDRGLIFIHDGFRLDATS